MRKLFCALIMSITCSSASAEVAKIGSLAAPHPVGELDMPYRGDAPEAAPPVQCVCVDVWAAALHDYMMELEFTMQPRGLMGPMS